MKFDICGFGTNNLLEEFVLAEEIVIFPNPFREDFTIVLPKSSELIEVNVIDLSGKLLMTNSFFNVGKMIISYGGSAGTYFVTIKTNESVKVLKLVKE